MVNKTYKPIPVIDTLDHVIKFYNELYANENPIKLTSSWLSHCFDKSFIKPPTYAKKDYQIVLKFLYGYRGSTDTFSSYRRELERLIQWSWFVRNKSLLSLKRDDIEAFIEFCLNPPKRWITLKKYPRFRTINGERVPTPEWAPFEAQIPKIDRKKGQTPTKNDFKLSQAAIKVMFSILSSFYNYLLQEELASSNPVALMRQKSKFLQKNAQNVIRRLSNHQWEMVLNLSQEKAVQDVNHERTVFILSCLFYMYLRISELVSSPRWTPTMGDFFKDPDGHWWFKTVSKGNKFRQIAVNPEMLKALKHYRQTYLNLPSLPSLNEKTPLIGKLTNTSTPIKSAQPIRNLVQSCFCEAGDLAEKQGDTESANVLRTATVHWLRHTGISEDVKHRPREHVRDDAGHSSSAITDRYINVELRERAKSASKTRSGEV